ncbi:hypothetical protein JOB18_040162 [Solea senegalensis]|uniref:Uncharacterized protein n=1 Tax=Solea senegalensis TaxID=28829 RepID=A0AAV6QKR7_SOLSE|nr:hypothetical protein JOB18_040162 [Solea senegalensis]
MNNYKTDRLKFSSEDGGTCFCCSNTEKNIAEEEEEEEEVEKGGAILTKYCLQIGRLLERHVMKRPGPSLVLVLVHVEPPWSWFTWSLPGPSSCGPSLDLVLPLPVLSLATHVLLLLLPHLLTYSCPPPPHFLTSLPPHLFTSSSLHFLTSSPPLQPVASGRRREPLTLVFLVSLTIKHRTWRRAALCRSDAVRENSM